MTVILSIFAMVLVLALSRNIVASIFALVFTWMSLYFGLPTFAYGYFGIPFIVTFIGLIGLAGYANKDDDKNILGIVALCFIIVVGLFYAIFIPFVTSSPMFNSGEYRALLGDVKESNFTSDTAPVDTKHVRLVDEDVAYLLAEKKLGEHTALGSQVEIGDMDMQMFNGELYWVAPLNHNGFFRWMNTKGTPGYVIVSATNEQDVRLVQEVNGVSLTMRYNMGAYFGDDPYRYVYNNGYMRTATTDYTFEIDEEGNPFYVATRYVNKVGYLGSEATGVVVLNVQTGEIKDYNINDAPSWIDRIQPKDIVETQINDWGLNVHGWLNSSIFGSGLDTLNTTNGMSLVYGDDGKAYWYTGLTSTGADESTVGFMLVNSHTKEVRFYKQAGATETAARGSAEGAVQEKGYKASHAILYNVGGLPTYFMTLKDKGGLIKSLAFVSVINYQTVGIGDTVETALRAYQRSLSNRGNALTPDAQVKKVTLVGQVDRIGKDDKENYYLVLGGSESIAFTGGAGLTVELPLTRVGDRVSISYNDGGSGVVDMSEFDNLELNFPRK